MQLTSSLTLALIWAAVVILQVAVMLLTHLYLCT